MPSPVPRPAGAPDDATATVRRARLADVPALARLLTETRPAGEPVPPEEAEPARKVLRLVLAHHTIEHGHIWIREIPGEPDPVSAAIWLPPAAQTPDPSATAALGTAGLAMDAAAGPAGVGMDTLLALAGAPAGTPHWLAVAAGLYGTAADVELLEPGLALADAEGGHVLALAAGDRDAGVLAALGFGEPLRTVLVPGLDVWISRRPPRPGAASRRPYPSSASPA